MANVGLVGCARIIVEDMANVSKNERAVVITDPNYLSKNLPDLIFECCLPCGADSIKLTTTPPGVVQDPLSPSFMSGSISKLARTAADGADVVFACTSKQFPQEVKLDLTGKGKKVIQIHCVNDEMVLRLTPVDLDLMERRVSKLLKILPKTEKAHLTSPEGTDITFSLKNCVLPVAFDGICHPGELDAMPAGNIDALPLPGTGSGVIVLDGSIRGWGLVTTPIRITVKDGSFDKIEGGPEAAWLDKSIKKALAAGDENANHWAEFLLGMHPNALIAGYEQQTETALLFEDERRLGAVNIGWGADGHLGGKFRGKYHGDGMIKNVTVTLDGITIIKEGAPTKELQ